jgi:hypothetical protein
MARAARRWNSALLISGLGSAGEVTASESAARSVARSVDLDRHFVRVVESLFLVTSDNLDVESDHVKVRVSGYYIVARVITATPGQRQVSPPMSQTDGSRAPRPLSSEATR